MSYMSQSQFMSYREAAKFINVPESFLRKLVSKEEIPYLKIGSKVVRFDFRSLCVWLEMNDLREVVVREYEKF